MVEIQNDNITIENNKETLDIEIKSKISLDEQKEFIARVMTDVELAETGLVMFDIDLAFYTHFLSMFTNFSFTFRDIENVVLIASIKESILSYPFFASLREYVEKQVTIVRNKPTYETLETVSSLANRSLDGINKVCDVLDNIKDLTKNGKFLKVIPKKKLDTIFEWIQKIVNGLVVGLNQESHDKDNIVDLK